MLPPGFRDIAVIGIACRFPGASTPEAFWANLVGGIESITRFSDEELLAAGIDKHLVHDPHYVKAAPVIDDHDAFDAAFFGYSPREARLMDPQQRHFLEVAWEAIEDAGYDPLGEKGIVAIYAGVGGMVSSYALRHDHPELRGQTGDIGHIGNDRDFLPSRVAFKLNLTGPAVNVQTACSTSLVAVHLACRTLRDGEAEMALAGASVVRVPHISGYLAEPGGIQSPDGHCRAFDAEGSGTLFGSGVAAIVLKPLPAALAHGDRVYAVIKGSAVTNDGAVKINYTASTVTGQTRAMTEALALAGVDPDSIGYVECHGTATTLGDPLEIQALTRAFRTRTQRVQYCAIGSVKTNFGHLEQCAGLAGLIKTILALDRGVIPPSLHFNTPNPRIPFERSPFFVNVSQMPFEQAVTPRRAAVNSVGMGGTNAFLVLEESPPRPEPALGARPMFALALSAKSGPALAAQAANFRARLTADTAPQLLDFCYTANNGRHHFEHRCCAVGAGRSELADALDRFVADPQSQSIKAPGPIIFLYSGQGAQYPRMGEALYHDNPMFRAALDHCLDLFAAEGVSLRETLLGNDDGRLTKTFYAQPALFSLQVALSELWKAWGIEPDIVLGHSVGEFAAAVAAGVCTIEDAAQLVAARARLMEELPEHGAMVSIAAAFDAVQGLLAETDGALAIAADNAPDRLVLSGPDEAVEEVIEHCARHGIPAAPLNTSHAFHSALMDPMLAGFEAVAVAIAFAPPKIRWISTLTGEAMAAAPDARYWRDQIRRPVRFRQAIETAALESPTYLEIGPAATLTALGRRCVPDGGIWLSSLKGRGEDWRSILEALGELYRQGRTIGWQAVGPQGGRRVSLPTYPFQHERFWLESRGPSRGTEAPNHRHADAAHPLLGDRLGGEEASFEGLLGLERFAFLDHHRVFGHAVLPTAAILDALTAAARHSGFSHPVIEDFIYERALAIPDDQPLWTIATIETAEQAATFRLHSTGMTLGDPWLLHASGTIRDDPQPPLPAPYPIQQQRAATEIPTELFYRSLDAIGLSYGAAFRGVRRLWRDCDQVFAEIALPADINRDGYGLHPAFLDACLHVYAALTPEYAESADAPPAKPYVPISLDGFWIYRLGVERARVHGVAVERASDDARLKFDIGVYAEDGAPVALLRGLTVRRATEEILAPAETPGDERLLYTVDWREAPATKPSLLPARYWYVVADRAGVGEHLGNILAEQDGATVVVLNADVPGLDTLLDEAPQGPVGIVDLRALDMPTNDLDGPTPVPQADALLCSGILDLVKALDRVRDRFPQAPRLWFATRAIDTIPSQGLVWGLGRSFALEYPEMWGGLVDLPSTASAEEAAVLLHRELRAQDGESEVRFRAGSRLVPRFARLGGVGAAKLALAADATYWIVGGLGRLGLDTAEALIDAGARHLALTGRTHPSTAAAAGMIEKLTQRAEIAIVLADAADEAALGAALSRIQSTMPPLKGVIHAAAVFEDALLVNADCDLFERVMRPKVAGAWNLHRATLGLDLDFFWLFSSVLSLWGAAGQGAYTAANAFLDTLAHYRRGQGLPAMVFNWGPWEDAARWGAVGAAMWKQRGTNALPPKTCLKILLSQLRNDSTQIAVTDTHWPEFLAQFAEIPPFFREVAPAAKPADIPPAPGGGVQTRAEETIGAHAAQVLGLGGPIDPGRPLNELGLDSLLAVTLANRLRRAFDRAVPTAALLRGPSVRELAARLFPELPQMPKPALQTVAPTAWIGGNRWLVMHRANPAAKLRLLAFPFAGGGAATFRPWVERLDPAIELIAIEPPGRQTRIDEAPIRDLETLLQQLIPELLPFLDKPFAVYGHCLGALTLFETVRRLIGAHQTAPMHVFVSGARPPDELQRQQDFEGDLIDRLLRLPQYNLFEPIYRQPDGVFSEAIRRFNVLATESLVQDAELRRLILPAIRAEFEMASNYRYDPEEPWDVPITCLTGTHDAYVSIENARSWARFTKRRFQLFTLDSEHFIVVDDDRFLLQIINRELTSPI